MCEESLLGALHEAVQPASSLGTRRPGVSKNASFFLPFMQEGQDQSGARHRCELPDWSCGRPHSEHEAAAQQAHQPGLVSA